MSYDPYGNGNPGRGPGGQHPWEVGPVPRPYEGALPPDGRVNPDHSPSFIDYQNSLAGARLADEQRRIAETSVPRYHTPSTSGVVAPRTVQPTKPTVSATAVTAKPAKPIVKPTPQLPPGKYLVIDERKPRLGSVYPQLIFPILGSIFALTMMNVFFAFMLSNPPAMKAFAFTFAVSIVSFGSVLYRAENTSTEKYKPADIWKPILLCLPVLPVASFIVYGIEFSWVRIGLFGLLGLMCMFLYASVNDSSEITKTIANKNWGKNVFTASLIGQRCHLCNGIGEPAVALRRYRFADKNARYNYTPVCEKHRHYVRIVTPDGKVQWPQNEDCTQPGLIKMKVKK